MMMQLRQQAAKIVTAFMFGLLILSFAVWGIGDVFRTSQRLGSVVEVGDITVDQRTFSRRLSREVNRLQAEFGQTLDGEQIRALGVGERLLQRLVTGALLDQQAADMGLVVSEDEVKRQILAEPLFRNESGTFDRNRFLMVLDRNRMSEDQFVETLRQSVRREQLSDAATSGVAVSRTLLEDFYTYREERRIAETVRVPSGAGGDLAEPSEDALQETYENFADRFRLPEYHTVKLVELRAEDLAEETVIGEEDLRAEFEARRYEFSEPERRDLLQLVFDSQGEAEAFWKTLADGRALATAAEAELGRQPVALDGVAREDLAAQFPALTEAAFALGEGEVGGPVETSLGWHVFQVTAITPAHEPSFEEARAELEADLKRRRAADSLISLANELDDELAGGASLEEAAEALGLPIRTLEAIDREGRNRAGEEVELPADEEFLSKVFAAAEGEESLLQETSAGDYYIYAVENITPPTLRPLDEVRGEVRDLWRREQARARARERAEALAERVRQGTAMAEVAEAEGLTFAKTEPIDRFGGQDGASPSPELTGKLFEMSTDEVAVVRAGDDWVIARLVEVRPGRPDENTEEVDALGKALRESLRDDLMTAFTRELEGVIGVSVNQGAFEDVLSSY